MAVILAAAAVAAAGCGSSSSSKTTAKPPAAPSTPATPSTSTTSTAANPIGEEPKVGLNTALSSSTFKNAYVKNLVGAGAPSAAASKYVDCFVSKLTAQGISTVGQLKQDKSKALPVAEACLKSSGA